MNVLIVDDVVRIVDGPVARLANRCCLHENYRDPSYRRGAELFTGATRALDPSGAGWTLHQLRHSDLAHEAEDDASTLARSRHASVRSLERYARPGVDAVGAYVVRRDPATRRRHPRLRSGV